MAMKLSRLTKGGAAFAATIKWRWRHAQGSPEIADEENLAVAKASVQRAKQGGAPQAAPVELRTATGELARAEEANADHDGDSCHEVG